MAEIIGIFPHWGQAPEPLWREGVRRRLPALRGDRDETLAQTADRAGISPQYLSEIERGRKEPSSEMIAALAGALDITVADLMAGAAEDLRQLAITVTMAITSTTSTTATTVITRSGQRPSGPVALAMVA